MLILIEDTIEIVDSVVGAAGAVRGWAGSWNCAPQHGVKLLLEGPPAGGTVHPRATEDGVPERFGGRLEDKRLPLQLPPPLLERRRHKPGREMLLPAGPGVDDLEPDHLLVVVIQAFEQHYALRAGVEIHNETVKEVVPSPAVTLGRTRLVFSRMALIPAAVKFSAVPCGSLRVA